MKIFKKLNQHRLKGFIITTSIGVAIFLSFLFFTARDVTQAASSLQYFGYYGVDDGGNTSNYISEVAPFTNIASLAVKQPTDNIVSRVNVMAQNNVKPFVSVQDIFFDFVTTSSGSGHDAFLRPDYLARWNTFVSTNQSGNPAQLGGIYVVDEPTWNGITFDELKTAADTIKSTLPTVPTLIIEAYPIIDSLRVPQSIDWIGFDQYGIMNPNTDVGYKAKYTALKSKRSRADQKIVVVMDGSWNAATHGAVGITQSDMAQVATNYYDFAKSDPDVVAVGVFIWSDEVPEWMGTRDLPSNVISEHRRIGALITGKIIPSPAPAPALTSVSPASVTANQAVTLTVNGSNFRQGIALVYSGPTSGTTTPVFISSNQLRVDSAMLSPGTYTFSVKNPDGKISGNLNIVAAVSPVVPSGSLNLTKLSVQVSPFTDSLGGVHPIEIYEFTDVKSGQLGHFMLVLGDNGQKFQAPYSTIVVNEPYTLFPAPPSTDPADVLWSQVPPPSTDISLSPGDEIRKCSTPRCPARFLSTSFADIVLNSEWYLRNGYSVAVTFGRFYAARGLLSGPYEVISVIHGLKSLASVDAGRIGLSGSSLGGFQTVYPLSRADMPLSVSAAIALAPPVDWKLMENYYYSFLPTVQSSNLLQVSHDFSNGYFNRLYKSVGTNLTDPRWSAVTNSYVASNINTPILLISGTDDMLVPSSQTVNLYNSLKVGGKKTNKFVYQNGAPPFSTKSAQEQAHGISDQNSPVKIDFLTKIYFVKYVPPSIGTVTFKHPEDTDIVATLATVRTELCANPNELLNYSEIVSYMANPKLSYISSDSRIPSGSGPNVISRVINLVWANEGINWNSGNVISNLLSGRIPTVCHTAPAPTLSSVSPSTIQIGPPITLSFKGSSFLEGAVLIYSGPTTGETPLRFVSSSEMGLDVTLDPSFPPGSYLVRIKNLDGQLSGELALNITTSPVVPPSPTTGAPTLTSVSPASVTANQAVTLTVNGSNFRQGIALVYSGPTSGTTTPVFISSNQLRVDSAMLSPGTYTFSVKNPDGKISGNLNIVAAVSPTPTSAPTLTSVSPASVTANQAVTITINGSNFQQGVALTFSGPTSGTITPVFLSSSQLRVDSATLSPGTYTFSVKNPDGKISGNLNIVAAVSPVAPPISSTGQWNTVPDSSGTGKIVVLVGSAVGGWSVTPDGAGWQIVPSISGSPPSPVQNTAGTFQIIPSGNNTWQVLSSSGSTGILNNVQFTPNGSGGWNVIPIAKLATGGNVALGGGTSSSGSSASTPPPSSSGGDSGLVPCGYQEGPGAAEDCQFEHFIKLAKNVMNFLLFVIAVPIAAISFAWAGWLYLSAAGNESKVQEAHKIFGTVVLGLSLALAAWLIVNAIVVGLGVGAKYNFLGTT